MSLLRVMLIILERSLQHLPWKAYKGAWYSNKMATILCELITYPNFLHSIYEACQAVLTLFKITWYVYAYIYVGRTDHVIPYNWIEKLNTLHVSNTFYNYYPFLLFFFVIITLCIADICMEVIVWSDTECVVHVTLVSMSNM